MVCIVIGWGGSSRLEHRLEFARVQLPARRYLRGIIEKIRKTALEPIMFKDKLGFKEHMIES